MKLRPKILSLVLGVLITSITMLSIPLYWYTRSALEDELDKRLLNVIEMLSGNIDQDLVKILLQEPNLIRIREKLEADMEVFLTTQTEGIGLYSGDGLQLAGAGYQNKMQPQLEFLLNSFSSFENNGSGIITEIYRLPNGEYLKAAGKVVRINSAHPVVIIAWGSAEFMAVTDQLLGSIFWITILAVTVTIILTVVFSTSLIRPVKKLSVYAQTIQKNIYSPPVYLDRNDELGDLNRSLTGMHAEIKENEQRNKQLLSGIAHEIKNPLGGMEIYTGLLKEELQDNPTRQSYLEKIVTELQHLKQIVSAYLDYARPPKSDIKKLSITAIIEDVHRLLLPELKLKDVRFTQSGEGEIFADESKLRSIFVNLIKNSLEAVEQEGAIGVAVTVVNSIVRVEIEDNGAGITDENLERIFQPYFTTREKGYGLGLPIVKNILDEMNGTIFVESQVGKGTSVILELPRKYDE